MDDIRDELLRGESDQLEYKVSRSRNAKAYLKTVVAFSNSHGGTIVFGVDDKTREVVGIPDDDVFQEMDAIANAVSDAITPTVIPTISLQQLEGKTVILVDVPEGRQLPYYIKADGFECGVFTRVGATSRPANLDYVREIMAENSPQGFDRMPNRDAKLTEESIAALCARMRKVALAHSRDDAERASVKEVTKNQLLKWGVLVEREGNVLPTNAYALLTGEANAFSWRVQCGVFRGSGRSVFLDRREYEGSVIDQIESAYQYALSKINMGANFDDLVRRDEYEIPMWSIRELITNAILHRSYIANSCVQVCLYDDCLEISSPGGLKRGITLAEALAGRSESRNQALAQAFYYMKLIENWGTGLKRVQREITEFGLREPEFVVSDNMFRVNIYRMSLAEFGEKLHPTRRGTTTHDASYSDSNRSDEQINEQIMAEDDSDEQINEQISEQITNRQRSIISLIVSEPSLSYEAISSYVGSSIMTIRRDMAELVRRGLIRRVGARKNGHWEVLERGDG